MSTTTVVLVLVVVVLLAVVAWLVYQRQRSDRLRSRFGPEYERTVDEAGNRRSAEAELEARQRRVERLRIHSLDADERERFASEWRAVQARFVDAPFEAIGDADRLIGEVMAARGYPVSDFDQRVDDVSVDHPAVVEHYRIAHDIATREQGPSADTESLRQAMVHYRALFDDLLAPDEDQARSTKDAPMTPRRAS